ncbi:MAG: hypothetical protein B7Z73_08880, partial [Planctomycetia bacterium 21-64-5]
YWSGLVLAVGPIEHARWGEVLVWSAVAVGIAVFGWSCRQFGVGLRVPRQRPAPLVSILVILLGAQCGSRCAVAEGDAETSARTIRTVEDSIDLGTLERIPRDGRIIVEFQWRNTTDRALKIRSTRVGCVSCTSVAYDHVPVPPGGVIKVSVTADLRGRYGKLVFAAVVTLEADAAPAKQLAIRCFRNMPPTASARVLDFGEVCPRGATRQLTLTAALAPGNTGLRSIGAVRSSNAAVSCELKDTSDVAIQIDESGKKLTAGYTLRFEARAAADRAPGPLDGELSIPVRYNGSKMEVTVPFRGRVCGLLTSRPSSATCFATPAETERRLSLAVVWHDGRRLPSNVTVVCEHPRVVASFVPSKNAVASATGRQVTVGRIDAVVNVDAADSFDTVILITAHSADGQVRLSVPLKTRIVHPKRGKSVVGNAP